MSNSMRFVTDLSKGVLGKPDSKKLWTEIISHIPDEVLLKPNVKILSIACGHCTEAVVIAKRMLKLGISKEQVNSSIYLIDKYQFFTNEAKKKYGFKNVILCDILKWETDMKFDVIVGNPPFQESKKHRTHPLWTKILDNSFNELLKPNGFLSFITPHIGRRKVLDIFNNNEIVAYNGFDVKERFNLGSTFCFYILRKTKRSGLPTSVKTNNGWRKMDIPFNLLFLPNYFEEECFEFIQRMTSKTNHLQVRTDSSFHTQGKSEYFSETKDHTYKFLFQHTGTKILYSKVDHPSRKLKKVICSSSGKLNPKYDSGEVATTQNSWFIEVHNKEEGDKLIQYLQSKDVVKFVNLISGNNSGFNDAAIYRMLVNPIT